MSSSQTSVTSRNVSDDQHQYRLLLETAAHEIRPTFTSRYLSHQLQPPEHSMESQRHSMACTLKALWSCYYDRVTKVISAELWDGAQSTAIR